MRPFSLMMAIVTASSFVSLPGPAPGNWPLSAWLARWFEKIVDFVVKIAPLRRDLPLKTLTLGRLRLGCRQLRAVWPAPIHIL
jgi:hypothetical protein